jgi:hypothetical protein
MHKFNDRYYQAYLERIFNINLDVILNRLSKCIKICMRAKLGNCQINHCYNQTYDMINSYLRKKRLCIQKIRFADKYLKLRKV